MTIEVSQFGADEFGFHLQTNGPVDAAHFRDFLDLICGNTYVNRAVSPVRVDIIELANGSIRGRLRAWFDESPWSKRKARRIDIAYEQNLYLARAALRQADASDLANVLAGQANTIAEKGIALIARQNAIALATFLSGIVSLVYANLPSSDAERIAKLMEIDGVSRIQIATRTHAWTIERQNIEEYRERSTATLKAQRRKEGPPYADPASTFTLREAITTQRAPEIPAAAEKRIADLMSKNASGGPIRTRGPESARPAAPATAAFGRLTTIEGIVRRVGDAFTIEPHEAHASQPILLPPDGQIPVDGRKYQATGRLFQPHPDLEILSVQLLQPLE